MGTKLGEWEGFNLGCNFDRVRSFRWVEVAGLFSWWNLPWGFGGVMGIFFFFFFFPFSS